MFSLKFWKIFIPSLTRDHSFDSEFVSLSEKKITILF